MNNRYSLCWLLSLLIIALFFFLLSGPASSKSLNQFPAYQTFTHTVFAEFATSTS